MTFLNALLALGTAAFTIPLIIHLLNRSRYLTIDWGAMHLLDASVRVNSRRIEWKQWLLLLIRCMIPVLLALAMSRPMVLSWKDSGKANAMALAILLDDSLSMQIADASVPAPAVTRWQRACDELTQIADQLPTGSSIHLILAGTPAESHPDLNAGSLKELALQLRTRSASAGNLGLSTGADLGLEWLNRSTLSKRHLMVISDFEIADWGPDSDAHRMELQQQISQGATPISASWVNVASPTTFAGTSVQPLAQSDIAIKSMEVSPRYASPGGPLTVTATVQNYSEEAAQVPIVLFADVQEIDRQSINVQPRSVVTCRFRWIPKSTGDTVLSLRAEWNDGTTMDNTIERVMRIQDPVRVLLIDGARRPEAMKSESDFLRVALTPFALLQGQPGDLFSTRVVDPQGWDETLLKANDLVVLCNVPELAADRLAWLRSFAELGGGVVIALGDAIQVDRYNAWSTIAKGGLRPGLLTPNNAWKGSVKVSDTPFFEMPPQVVDSLASIQFQNRHTLSEMESDGWIGFRFGDEEPWILSHKIGQGRCAWILSSCDDGDSNLPARPAYLPLVQRLMLFVDQTPAGLRWMEPGQTWADRWTVAEPADSSRVEWGRVGESTVPIAVEATESAEPGRATFKSEITLPRLIGVVQGRLGTHVQKMMVDTSSLERNRELNRDRLTQAAFEALANQSGAMPFTSVEDWMSQMQSRWSGRELWLWFWMALIGLVLAEIAMQQSFRARTLNSAAMSGLESATPGTSKGVA